MDKEVVEVEPTEREKIYAEIAEENHKIEAESIIPIGKTVVPEFVAAEPVPDTTPAEVEGNKQPDSREEVKEGEQAEKPAEEVKNKKEEKFVPLEALHEEREKRKAEKKAREELEKEIVELKSKVQKPVLQENYAISDYDAEIISLKNQVDMLRDIEEKREQLAQLEGAKNIERQRYQNIETADKELREAGYVGFKQMIGAVAEELYKMQEAGEDAVSYDNPTGWKHIFTTKVFPNIREAILEQSNKAILQGKKEQKQKANLVSTPGSQPSPTPSIEPGSDSYFAMRNRYKI